MTLGSKKSKGPDWRRRQEEKISSEILELKTGKKGRPRSVLAHVETSCPRKRGRVGLQICGVSLFLIVG